MSIIRRKIVWALAVVLVAAAAANLAAAEGTVLKHHQGTGDKAVYDFGLSARVKVEGSGGSGTAQAEMTLQMKCLAEFVEVLPNGHQGLRGQIVSGTLTGKGEGETKTVAVKDVVVNYELSPQGEMKAVELVAGDPPILFFPGAHLGFGPDDAFLLGGRAVFPDRPVSEGEKWGGTAQKPHPVSGEIQEEQYESRVLGTEQFRGRKCLKIRTTGTFPLEGSAPVPGTEVVAQVRGMISGHDIWLFDPERGLIMSVEGSHRLVVSARAEMGAEVAGIATTSAVINIRSVLTEFNGEKIAER